MTCVARLVCCVGALAAWWAPASAQTAARALDGMWSDPPDSIVGRLCGAVCSDVAIDALYALVDDPKNDAVPYARLRAQAITRQIEHVRSLLTPPALQTFPLDPADDPSFLRCEPYNLVRQMFAIHQLQITTIDAARIELRYGEWDARRTVYMDGRRPLSTEPARLGHSTGRWEGQELVVRTSGIAAGLIWAQGNANLEHSDRLTTIERYARGADGKTLWLTATLTDPSTFTSPLVMKRLWRWAPESKITPYEDCEIPKNVRRGVGR